MCIRDRLLTLTQMASMGLEQAAIYEMIAGAVDIIVHVGRDRTGPVSYTHLQMMWPLRITLRVWFLIQM